MTMLFILLSIISGQETVLPMWDLEGSRILDIDGMESPTALIFLNGQWFAGADLDEGFSGLYSLAMKPERVESKLVKYLPQFDIEDLAYNPETRQIRVVSSRRFSPEPKDWVGQFLELEPKQMRLAEVEILGISCLCFDESMRCGLVAAMPIDKTRWVGVKKKDPSTLYVLENRDGRWVQDASATLTYQRRFITVTCMRRWGSNLLFLVKDKWLVASLPLSRLDGELEGELRLEALFEFKDITKRLRPTAREWLWTGMAESFDIDDAGSLYVVLNNRNATFMNAAGIVPSTKPKIVVFRAKRTKTQ